MKIIPVELLMQAKDSFLDKVKKGRRGTFTWNKVEIDIPEYSISEDELSTMRTNKIGHVVVPAKTIQVAVTVHLDRVKGKHSNKRR